MKSDIVDRDTSASRPSWFCPQPRDSISKRIRSAMLSTFGNLGGCMGFRGFFEAVPDDFFDMV